MTANKPTGLADYLRILRRRKWLIVVAFAVAVAAALAASLTQHPLYRATAQVLINRANIVSSITGVTDPSTLGNDPTRFIATQSDVARSRTLARRVVAATHVPGMTAEKLLASSTVTAATNADVLNIAVSSPRTTDAIRLANAYAEEYTAFKTDLDTARINDALKTLKARLAAMTKAGVPASSASYGTLVQYASELETVGRMLANNTQVLQHADKAEKIRPRPKRDALLGGLIGALIGIALALLAETLDRRLRSASEAESKLRLPVLARVPRPPRRLEAANQPVMLAEPSTLEAEPFRRLRTNLEFANLDRRARRILVTSAVGREGKSTTIANLAIVLARAGRKVVLVDLDLRKPSLHTFFRTTPAPGISDVILHRAALSEALRPIELAAAPAGNGLPDQRPDRLVSGHIAGARSTNGRVADITGLKLLAAGSRVANPGEFVANDELDAVLNTLASEFDYVLLDGPPFLAVGDTLTLSARVDAILVVSRLAFVTRSQLHDLSRQLHTSRAEKLGIVVAGAELEDDYDQVDDYYYDIDAAQRMEERAPTESR